MNKRKAISVLSLLEVQTLRTFEQMVGEAVYYATIWDRNRARPR